MKNSKMNHSLVDYFTIFIQKIMNNEEVGDKSEVLSSDSAGDDRKSHLDLRDALMNERPIIRR